MIPQSPGHWVSLETLIGVAPLLGFALDDRSSVRVRQDPAVARTFRDTLTRAVDPALLDGFVVAPLDLLLSADRREAHFLELNGSGIGGLTNLPEDVVDAVLQSVTALGATLRCDPGDVVVVAASERDPGAARQENRLLYEKILLVDALRGALAARGNAVAVTTLEALEEVGSRAVVLGFVGQLSRAFGVRDGQLTLRGRRVAAIVNDRLVLHAHERLGAPPELPFRAINSTFAAGADKAVAYGVLHDHPCVSRLVSPHCAHRLAYTRDELVAAVLATRPAVLKPRSTGQARGIEICLDLEAAPAEVEAAVDRSIAAATAVCPTDASPWPYTVCRWIDAATVADPQHRAHGHKFELRIVVFRDGARLSALPAIAKVSSARWDPAHPTREMLVNNVTWAAARSGAPGHRYILPLCEPATWQALGIDADLLIDLGHFALSYVEAALRSDIARGRRPLPTQHAPTPLR